MNEQAPTKFCVDCNTVTPRRSHHCPICQICVLRKDHHCFMTGGCVGLANQVRAAFKSNVATTELENENYGIISWEVL